MRRKQNKYTTIAGISLVMVVLFWFAQNLKNFKNFSESIVVPNILFKFASSNNLNNNLNVGATR